MDLQDLINGMNDRSMRERSKTQMTLGGLIGALEKLPSSDLVSGIERPHSYRGYYSDLAFELNEKPIMVSEALKVCRNAMGRVFIGYKGGEFQMGEMTLVWIANYGSCGKKISSIQPNGVFELKEDTYE